MSEGLNMMNGSMMGTVMSGDLVSLRVIAVPVPSPIAPAKYNWGQR